MKKGNIVILQLCPLQCKTAREKRGSNLSSNGVFGEHLLKGKSEGEGDIQNKMFNIILISDFVGCNINGLLSECTPSSKKERKA